MSFFGGAGPSWTRAKGRSSAVDTAVARPADKCLPPGIAKKSATTKFDIAVSSDKARHPEVAKRTATTKPKLAESFGEAGPSWPRANDVDSAAATAAIKSAGIARPLGIVKQCATTKPELAGSSGEPQSLLVKLGILESQSTEPWKNPNWQCGGARLSGFPTQAVSLPLLVSSRSFVDGLSVSLADSVEF